LPGTGNEFAKNAKTNVEVGFVRQDETRNLRWPTRDQEHSMDSIDTTEGSHAPMTLALTRNPYVDMSESAPNEWIIPARTRGELLSSPARTAAQPIAG